MKNEFRNAGICEFCGKKVSERFVWEGNKELCRDCIILNINLDAD